MTNVEVSRRRTKPWLGIGLSTLALGIVTFAVAVPLTSLEVAGWPWHASISQQADRGDAEIKLENGQVEVFTGTPAQAQAWLDDRQAALKEQHGIPTKIAIGKALTKAGYVLVLLGGGVVLWRVAAALAARRRVAVKN
jgi:hypothetical protein